MTTPQSDAAYLDGVNAALRRGKYNGYHTEPPCPYPPGSKEHKDWFEGIDDAENDSESVLGFIFGEDSE